MTLGTNNEYSAAQLNTVEAEMDNPGEREIKASSKERDNLKIKCDGSVNKRNTKVFQIAEVVEGEASPCER